MKCQHCGLDSKWFMHVYSFREFPQYGTMETHEEQWCLSCVVKEAEE